MIRNDIVDICSPSCTGLGLEILRSVPLIQAIRSSGFRPRLWTFHPLAYDDCKVDLVPLVQHQLPLIPDHKAGSTKGVVWMPHSHPNGPYVCKTTLRVALERNFEQLEILNTDFPKAGAYPAEIARMASRLGVADEAWSISDNPLYPPDSHPSEVSQPIIVNLIGTNGNCKGLSDAYLVKKIADSISKDFPSNKFVFLLNARVCSGQLIDSLLPNVRFLLHLDTDSRVSRILNPNAVVITVEGGLAHAALYRGCKLTILGLEDWLNKTAYLYPLNSSYRIKTVESFSEPALLEAVFESIMHSNN